MVSAGWKQSDDGVCRADPDKYDGKQMGVLRIFTFLTFSAFLAGCAATNPLLPAQENFVLWNTDQPEPTPTAEVRSAAKTPKSPAPKPTTASVTSDKGALNSTTPEFGSPEWEKEQAENERKEQHLKQVLESICHGC